MTIVVAGRDLSVEQVVEIARGTREARLGDGARAAMAAGRVRVERAAAGRAVYGVNTGFGALADATISPGQIDELQHALLRSHAAGYGPWIEPEVVRAMMLLRAAALATGLCGVRPVVAEALLAALNHGLVPAVPEHGSLGASGDLAPAAHVALCLTGEGEVLAPDGGTRPAREALQAEGLEPLALESKEGLALINSTDGMLANLLLALADATVLLETAEVAAAMSIEALLGTDRPFQADLQRLRPHPGQVESARHIAGLLDGSEIVRSHRDSSHVVQDAYSLRCAPQVIGAARDTFAHVMVVARRELASVIDNPVVLPDGRIESTGNFHGAPLALVADFLAIALSEVGAIAERRIDCLLDGNRSRGLPAFLAPESGLNSGLMILHYTAAALAAENARQAHPASVTSIPTSAMQEDHVSMGWAAARNARAVLGRLRGIVAVEVLAATWALWWRSPLRPSPATGAVRDLMLAKVAEPGPDRCMAPLLERAAALVACGAVANAARQARAS